jgi:hypothetical protein
MKKISIKWIAVMTALLSLTSCQKENAANPSNANALAAESQTKIPTKNVTGGSYVLSVDPITHKSSVYKAGLTPSNVSMGLVGAVTIGGTTVTYANGLAYLGGRFWISTSSLSNFPNKLLLYTGALVLAGSSGMTNPNISHIEYSTALGNIYGLDAVSLKINTVSSAGLCTPVSPAIVAGGGYHLSGLTDYKDPSFGYGIAVVALDNTAAIDKIIGVNLTLGTYSTIASNNFTPASTLGIALQFLTTGFYTGTDIAPYKWFYNIIGSGPSAPIPVVTPAGLAIADIAATN